MHAVDPGKRGVGTSCRLYDLEGCLHEGCSCAQELAVMVARSRDGSTKAFPVVETVHQNSILLVTEAPAHVAPEVRQRAQQVAESAVACLDGERHGSEPAELAANV